MLFRAFATVTAIWVVALSSSTNADPLNPPVTGPKLICFKYSTFALDPDESITDVSGSPEGISVTVKGPSGSYSIDESEIFAPAKGRNQLVYTRNGTHVYRVTETEIRYAIYGRTSFSKDKDRLVIWLSGDALKASNSPDIYRRVEVRDPAGIKCQHTFTYSWEF